jgi:hypothetical protein
MQPQRPADQKMIVATHGREKPCTRQIVRWIAEQAIALDDGVTLLDGVCKALCDFGLPLWRMSVIMNAIDPSVRGLSFDWRRDLGASLVQAAHEIEDLNGFERFYIDALEGGTLGPAAWANQSRAKPSPFSAMRKANWTGG